LYEAAIHLFAFVLDLCGAKQAARQLQNNHGHFAHPDAEAVTNASSLLARYARDGYKVYLVIATKGEIGTRQHAGVPVKLWG
jgi:hypothetical protein